MNLKTLAAGIKATIMRVGFDATSEMTKFVVIINGQHFDYSCGIRAHVSEDKLKLFRARCLQRQAFSNDFQIFQAIMAGRIRAVKNLHCPAVVKMFDALSELARPTVYDVLYCIRLDSEAANMTFAGWCSEFGYDSDSIQALKTYDACSESAKKLMAALGPKLYKAVMEAEDEE